MPRFSDFVLGRSVFFFFLGGGGLPSFFFFLGGGGWVCFAQKNVCPICGKGFDNNYFNYHDRLLGGFKR